MKPGYRLNSIRSKSDGSIYTLLSLSYLGSGGVDIRLTNGEKEITIKSQEELEKNFELADVDFDQSVVEMILHLSKISNKVYNFICTIKRRTYPNYFSIGSYVILSYEAEELKESPNKYSAIYKIGNVVESPRATNEYIVELVGVNTPLENTETTKEEPKPLKKRCVVPYSI